MSITADTYADLPAITRPLPSISPSTARKLQTKAPSSGSGDHSHASSTEDGHLWTRWGAALNGARRTLTGQQKLWIALLATAILIYAVVLPHGFLLVPMGLVSVIYLVAGTYKVVVLLRAESAPAAVELDPLAIPDEDLPMYTVLVPLYHEGKLAPILINQLMQIDYPQERLEVLLLVEHDDTETWTALKECALSPRSPLLRCRKANLVPSHVR